MRALCFSPIVALAVAAVAGCSAGASQDTAGAAQPAATSGARTQPLHALLRLENLVDGTNAAQADYRQTVAICRDAGWPVQALSDEQIGRLGTGTLELAIDRGHRLARATRWFWSSPKGDPQALCQFRFNEEVREDYVDHRISGYTGDEHDPGWHQQPVAEQEFDLVPLATGDVQRADDVPPGWADLGTRAVAGQPCHVWRNTVEVCMWTAGGDWGMSAAPTPLALPSTPDSSPGELVLSQEPANGTGTRVVTVEFTVGRALPAGATQPRTRSGAAP